MDKTDAKTAVRELTMMLIYLSRITEEKDFSTAKSFYAYKGYDFDALNELDEKGYINQGKYRNKTLALTDSGMEYAKSLLEKYGISDWV